MTSRPRLFHSQLLLKGYVFYTLSGLGYACAECQICAYADDSGVRGWTHGANLRLPDVTYLG